eukprot:CAMPEP_0176123376 /NCGR_PEP_ID=MMETSP0120_2-20121206/62166_1 /TAXON_ID=160619 /ORGANISM="Kryptoperidinium foliaceum, Strain CCMP 1326" /LENGTH=31 /DNA_ID= /DNA_START= /DNA_END= /DNA_ORIENTATION=
MSLPNEKTSAPGDVDEWCCAMTSGAIHLVVP